MNQTLLRSLIRNLVLEAFSAGTIAARTRDFQKEDPSVTPEEAKYYLDRFSDVQGSPHVQDRDIQRYSWRNRTGPDGKTTTGLKDFIDSKWSTRAFYEPVSTGDLEPVYESENGSLQIFLGDRREKCVTFRKNFEGRSGKTYSWCISRSDSSNLFKSYRFRADEPVFYYLFDFERETLDPLHACVIYVTNKDEYWLSDANNTGDNQYSWGAIAGMMPKIASLRGVFKHIPVSEQEKESHVLTSVALDDNEFAKLTRDQKEDYIGAGHGLSDGQIRNIWGLPGRVELINKLCNHYENVFLPLDIWKKIPLSTKKVVQDNFKKDETSQALYRMHYLGENKINGDLAMVSSNTPNLPENLEINGDLTINSPSSIERLPPNLKVRGDIAIAETQISELPPGLKCNGIALVATKIAKIDGDIFWDKGNVSVINIAESNNITEIPDGLVIKYLNLSNTKVQTLPSNIEIGTLIAFQSELTELPEGLSVNGEVILKASKNIKALPNNFYCGGTLQLAHTEIEKISPGTHLGGDVFISKDTKLKTLPPDLRLDGLISCVNGMFSALPLYQSYMELKRRRSEPTKESLSLLKKLIWESLRESTI